jgi:hypothetical protein
LINKRHAGGAIAYAQGKVDGAKESRKLHVETLKGEISSIAQWIKKSERKLSLARKFYRKSNWEHSKTGCNFPMACSIQQRQTNFKNLEFQIHNKKRKLYKLQQQVEHLKTAPIRVSVSHNQVFIVGSKGESFGNVIAAIALFVCKSGVGSRESGVGSRESGSVGGGMFCGWIYGVTL